MKKIAFIIAISIITTFMFSCGGGGGGVDDAIDETITITYNANGAESGTVPPSQRGSVSSPPPIQGNIGNLAKNGYILNATSPWNSKADGSGAIYTPGRGYTPENLTLYAQWIPLFNYQVISPVSPSPAMDGAQKSSANAYIKITGLTYEGRQLSDIVIPESIDGYTVVSIGANAFQDCGNIAGISIPENVTTIEDNAFAGCTGITTLIIPRSVTSIGSGTFSGCGGLNSIVLLSTTPPAMGVSAMEGCTATVSVPVTAVDTYKATEGWNTYSSNIAGYSTEIYIVTYDGQGATTQANPSGKEIVPPAVTVGQLPTAPIKTGYNFGGWFTEIEGGGSSFTASTVVSSNITVYAKWDEYNYTVTFNDQGATTPVGETSKIVSSPSTTVDSLPTEPSKGGFYFGGWNTKPDGTGTVFNANTTVSSDITIYAVWLNNPTFTVTFDGQGATTAANPSSKQVVSPAVTVGELPAPPLKTGYIFGGWYNQPEGAGGEFSASTVVTKNTTVYAKWNSYSYTVTFNDQGATTPVGDASKTVTSPNTTVGTLPTEPVNTGYYFGGWNTKSDGSGAAFNADTQVTGDITVYAMWMNNPTFTVTFNGQGATTQANPSTKQVVSPAVTVGELPDPPLKTGYIFGGWYTGQNGTGSLFTTSTIVNSNIAVYAKWDSYSYTVTFDGQGATTAASPTKKTVNSPAVKVGSLPTPPLKTGYNFGGWYNEPEGAGGEFTADTVVTGNKTVYAEWNSYNYTVTFDSQGATTEADPTSKTVSTPSTTVGKLPTSPLKEGYIFDGWYTQPNGKGTKVVVSTIIESDITVYAKWTELFTYNTNVSAITITGLTEEGKKLSSIAIPALIDGKPVTSISTSAFFSCKNLTNITLPNSIISIGSTAFAGCTGITSITIPASVTNIEYTAFQGCTSLTSITISNGVTNIRGFSGCTGLTSITIPDSVTSIGNNAFEYCTGLTSITIPDSVTSIGNHAFSGCTNLSEVTIPDGVTTIGSSAFSGCTGLTSITLPNSVTTIGSSAFSRCTSLSNITIPAGVTRVDNNAFSGCSNIVTINYNAVNCTFMGSAINYVFTGCSKIATLNIGNDVESIPPYAFSGCTGLTSITIPNSVTSIGDNAFSGCTNIRTVIFNATNCTYMGGAKTYYSDKTVFAGCNQFTTLIIGNNVESIPDFAFCSCTSLSVITIPNSVTTIGNYAFSGCSGLTSITIPNSVTTIGSSVFYECTSLSEITIPNSVTSIGDSVFAECTSLSEITIPNSVTTIGSSVFYECTSLASITIPNRVTIINNATFAGCTSLSEITIPDGVTTIVGAAFYGCTNLSSIIIPNSVTTIGSYAFNGCTSLASITIPNRVTIINNATFAGCTSLSEITIPDSVTTIGESAFSGCTGLLNITIPAEVTSIGNKAFSGCSNITSVNYNAVNCTTMGSAGNYVFTGCSKIKTLNIGNAVENIPPYAFSGCNGYFRVTIPDGVTIIRDNTFYDCPGLSGITISASVTSIGNNAFNRTSLVGLDIPKKLTYIGDYAFANSKLGGITFKSTNPPTLEESCFSNTNLSKMFVPSSALSRYKSAYGHFGCDIVVDQWEE